jgi:hypothetical protein
MKKIAMTICGVAFVSMMALAQNVDSTQNQNGSTDFRNDPIQDSAMTEPVNPQPIEGTPRTQDPTTSPIVQPQPQQQSQPQIQSQPELQSQPQLQPQQQQLESPLQTQPQTPTQSQPTLDPNSPSPQLNQPVQPTQQVQPAPTPTDPTGGTKPK